MKVDSAAGFCFYLGTFWLLYCVYYVFREVAGRLWIVDRKAKQHPAGHREWTVVLAGYTRFIVSSIYTDLFMEAVTNKLTSLEVNAQ